MARGRCARQLLSFLTLVVVPTVSVSLANAEVQAGTMAYTIEQLIEAYNSVDSVAYRSLYSGELKRRVSLASVGADIRGTMDAHGPIMTHEAMISSTGDRAVVLIEMGTATFDMHLRIDDQGKLLRDTWIPHRAPSTNVTSLSEEEQLQLKQRYAPVVVAMMEAIRSQDAGKLKSFMKEPANDDWTVEEYSKLIEDIRGRGEIQDYGPVEVTGSDRLCLPVYFDQKTLEFCFSISGNSEIGDLSISNYAPGESAGRTLADLGADTSRTRDLQDMEALARQFRADSGNVRLIALLSPT